MIPSSLKRVSVHTPMHINLRIKNETLERLNTSQDYDQSRRSGLEREWDIERAIEANASTLMLLGLGLGVFVNSKWLLLPAAVSAFLLQHAIQGWCPPVPILRRLGFRTQSEIDAERFISRLKLNEIDKADSASRIYDVLIS